MWQLCLTMPGKLQKIENKRKIIQKITFWNFNGDTLPVCFQVGWSSMRLGLFSKGDTVLLLGEGNFSFSVCLHKHKLPIDITATSFQSEPQSEHELQNIKYLESNDALVLFNVDATKLQENPKFAAVKFSKIIFNFPHVGGKMKIHLNRELLRNFFLSVGHILKKNGLVMVSLCQGQGGTPADRPQRRWDDTWQVAEMAAHGDFILTEVEPFVKENFPEYNCVGYRSQNVGFHLDDALVHIFSKKKLFDGVDRPLSMPFPDCDILAPPIYTELYRQNPNRNPESAISYLQKILIESLNVPEVEVVETLSLHKENQDGVQSEVNSLKRFVLSDPTDIFPTLFKLLGSINFSKKLILYTGIYSRSAGADFLTHSPIDIKFTILGRNLDSEIVGVLNNLISIFNEQHTIILNGNPLTYRNTETGCEIQAVKFHKFQGMDFCVINAQSICEYLFRTTWRQIWADHKITLDGIPTLKLDLLYPPRYEFDITLRYEKPFSDEDLFKSLWLGGGLMIEEVRIISEYASEKWSSKCYRIAYRSLSGPMYRKRVIRIHSMLGQFLETCLDVTVA